MNQFRTKKKDGKLDPKIEEQLKDLGMVWEKKRGRNKKEPDGDLVQ